MRRKRARFFARAFYSRESFAAVFAFGLLAGVGLAHLVRGI